MRAKRLLLAAILTCSGLTFSVGLSACMRIAPPETASGSEESLTPSGNYTLSSSLNETDKSQEEGSGTGLSLPTTETRGTDEDETSTDGTSRTSSESLSPEKTSESGRSSGKGPLTPAKTSRPVSGATDKSGKGEATTGTGAWWEIISGLQENEEASFSNPMPVGETAHFDGYDTLFDPFRAEVSVQQVFRGNKAYQMVRDASALNPEPKEGQEYLIAQVLVKITDSKDSEKVDVSPYFFSLAREDGRMYGDVTLFRSVTPVLSAIDVGETSIAYICFQVDKTDENPYIVFLSRAHGGLWFRTSDEEESEETTSETTSGSLLPRGKRVGDEVGSGKSGD